VTETCADDFATIWAGMEELRREREGAQTAESDLQRDAPTHRARTARWQPSEKPSEMGLRSQENCVICVFVVADRLESQFRELHLGR
jgi:hypothetical protein